MINDWEKIYLALINIGLTQICVLLKINDFTLILKRVFVLKEKKRAETHTCLLQKPYFQITCWFSLVFENVN